MSVILVMVLSLMGLRLQISPSHQQDYLLKVKHKTVDATSGQLFTMHKVRSIPTSQYRFQDSNVDTSFSWPTDAFWNRNCQHWGVVTTIFAPSKAVTKFVQAMKNYSGWCLVVAGDIKGPDSYMDEENVVFLSVERQRELAEHMPLVAKTPWNHFGRKNVAYLYAIANGAKTIWDFDDDNELLTDRIFQLTTTSHSGQVVELAVVNDTCRALNPYPLYKPSSKQLIWPRGYPMQYILTDDCTVHCTQPARLDVDSIGVYQMLANGDPDVDAIYRQTRPLPVFFETLKDDPPLIAPHQFFPFNAQATLWKEKAFWGLLLPITVHGRVSDIWRSYMTQTIIFRHAGLFASYMGPHVLQERNAHTLLADFDAEKPLYDRAGVLVDYLYDWRPKANTTSLSALIEQLVVDLVEHDILQQDDLIYTQEWLVALHSVGYNIPHVQTKAPGTFLEILGPIHSHSGQLSC